MKRLSNDLQEFIRLLEIHAVEYVIVGAWSVAFHGRPRYTGDLDIFVGSDPDNADRLMLRPRCSPNINRWVMVPFGCARAIHTVPTGLSVEPPSGPAIPETESA